MELYPPAKGKQRHLYRTADARINIAHGAVRSGKSVGTIWCWLKHILEGPEGDLLMVGNTTGALVRNVVIPYLMPLLGSTARLYQTPGNYRVEWSNRIIYLAGANNVTAEERIRGMTLAGAYGDELTTWSKGMLEQIDARMSIGGAKFWGTTNPDGPMHRVKKDWIDRADGSNIKAFHFSLEDNPFLPPSYIESLRAIHVGLWAKRFIEGLWAVAEGAVWPMFDPAKHVTREPVHMLTSASHIGLDAGFTHPAVAVALRPDNAGQRILVVSERAWEEATQHKVARDLDQWAARTLEPVQGVHYDPSAPSLGEELRLAGRSRVGPADNRVGVGLANVASLLAAGRLQIHESAEGLIQQIPSYVWDAKASAKGMDKPVKENDDYCDGLRYGVQGAEPVWRPWVRHEGEVEEYREPPAPGTKAAYDERRRMKDAERRRKQRKGQVRRDTGHVKW